MHMHMHMHMHLHMHVHIETRLPDERSPREPPESETALADVTQEAGGGR